MAGIGFQLRRMLAQDTHAGFLGAYACAGLVSSGPWVLSVGGVVALGLLAARAAAPAAEVTQFLVSVTWLMAGSLVLTGPLQLLFGRFVADRIYEGHRERIVPNLLGALEVATLGSGAVGSIAVLLAPGVPLPCRILLLASLVALSGSWVLVVLLSGVRAWGAVLGLFLSAGLVSLGAELVLRHRGLEGLLAGFVAGQAVALFGMLALVLRAFPGERAVRFEFLGSREARYELAAVGALFYLGVWADKACFWMWPETSVPVLGPLRFSVVYDLPVSIAYLAAIPAMAAMFLRLEADFADRCQAFFGGVRDGASLARLRSLRDGMTGCARRGLLEILEVQGATLALVLAAGPRLLRAAGLSPLYQRLLAVDAAAVTLQVLFLAILNVLFYLDQRRAALGLCALFAASNLSLTALSLWLGPEWYGFGFAGAALLACAAGLPALWRKLTRLDRDTFLLQPLWPGGRGPRRGRRIAWSSGWEGAAPAVGARASQKQ